MGSGTDGICCHPLDESGEEDRMRTDYATSRNGVGWTWHGTALAPQEGTWNARGTRVTAVLPNGAYYDGRATKEENFDERTGLAVGLAARGLPTARLRAQDEPPVADVRYVDAVCEPGGGLRLFYEAPRPDGAHELRTEHRPRSG
jgi:hypothetical protein